MSNLGAYQWITTKSKKVGGPIGLLLLTGAAGAAIYKLGEVGVKKCIKTIKSRQNSKAEALKGKIYLVTAAGVSNEGIIFIAGNQFKVLEKDQDCVLIEKIGDSKNPYFVSAEFLRSISDFEG